MMKKTKIVANVVYVLPFKASHCWVTDAKDKNVCEAYSPAIAKEIANLLNKEENV